jgi:hypothetical protein
VGDSGQTGSSCPGQPASSGTTAPGGGKTTGGFLNEATDSLGSDSADSVPVPLLVLAGLALLLVAAGAAGLIARRVQSRRTHP